MAREISDQELAHMAHLSRLELDEAEKKLFKKQLGQILEHMELLNSVSTDGVEPLYTVTYGMAIARDDIMKDLRSRKEILANAPETDGEYFIVPRIV